MLPLDKILAKKEDCAYCYSLLRRTRNIPMFTLWKTILSALNLKQPTSKTAKCFLGILFSGLKHLLSHTSYIWLILQAMEKAPAFNEGLLAPTQIIISS